MGSQDYYYLPIATSLSIHTQVYLLPGSIKAECLRLAVASSKSAIGYESEKTTSPPGLPVVRQSGLDWTDSPD